MQEYLSKVDPSGIAVTYIAAEKGLKKAELAIGPTPDSPDLSAARGLAGWSIWSRLEIQWQKFHRSKR